MRISDWSSDVCSSDLRCSGETEALTDIGAHREGNRGRSKSRIGGYFAVAVALHAIAYGFADDVHAGDGTAYEDCPVNGTAIYPRSEEPTSELQSLMRISYAVFCMKQKHNKRRVHGQPQ